MSEVDDIKVMLGERAEALAGELVPDGQRSGHYWIARCPWRDDSSPSFWINLPGQSVRKPGSYKDAGTGEKGGPLDLIMKVEGLDFRGALDWARKFLGLVEMSQKERQERAQRATRAQAAAREDDGEALEKARKWAFGKYVAAKKQPFLGSPADLYLQTRGIDVRRLGRMPGVLGWLPDQLHRETGTRWPVMLAGFQDAAGRTVALHRTFLAADGSGKAPVEPVRKMWPSVGGAAIRLWRGGSGLSVEDAAKHGLRERLNICEGVEDGLSIALGLPEYRVWCAGSLPNLALIKLPECIDEVMIAADNDWGKRQAKAQLDAGVANFVRQGVNVSIARSRIGKDMNDALRG